jgi:hypothetical protein
MKQVLTIALLFTTFLMISQVGINTTNPSAAAVLDVSSSSNGLNFGGLMPPRVSPSERDAIPVTAADEGLMVYVINPPNSQLQIWDGTAWQTLFPQNIEFSAVLAAWEMNGLSAYGPSPFDTSESSASVAVGGLTRGALTTTGGAAANAWGANGWFVPGPTSTQAIAIDNNKFVTFTITPSFGVNISLTTIEPFRVQRSNTGPDTGIIQYSLDGIVFTDIGTEFTYPIVGAPGNQIASFDLSGITDLQNLTSTSTVTFRIVNWGATNDGGTWYITDHLAGSDFIIRGNIK